MAEILQRASLALRSLREAFSEHRESIAAVVSLVYPMALGYGSHYLATLAEWQSVGVVFGALIGITITIALWPRNWENIPPVFQWILPAIGYGIGYAIS